MEIVTQLHLAYHENVPPPIIEKSNFLYSFSFLPKEERVAMHSIYAFCSYIDSIVDESPNTDPKIVEKKLRRLEWWEKELELIYSGNLDSKYLKPFEYIVKRFSIPKQYFITLIKGCRTDLLRNTYDTFEDLKEYCYGVASIVGLISIEIFGYKYEETKNYAINLGYALQLTNIMRDIKVDKDRGYFYLPQEDLDAFSYSRDDIINEVYNENFVELMRYQAKRARQYYHNARTMLRPDEKPTIVAAEIMDAIYYRLLEKIELNDFNIYKKKIRVSNAHKLMTALKHWLSVGIFISRIKKHP